MSSTTSKSNNNTTDSANTITESEDLNMFQAARRTGRRNALGDLSEHLSQVSGPNASLDVEKMAPHFQSMSIKN